MDWPPNYREVIKQRGKLIENLMMEPALLPEVNFFYSKHPQEWINDFCITYNPRNVGIKTVPFLLFDRQREFVDFLYGCLTDKESGLVEKARDIGATWLCVAFSVWAWRYIPGASIGWGSRKEQLVDRIGDPDSIFEKIRMIIRNLPKFMLPNGFDMSTDMPSMKIINTETGSVITGESGDNIGRGGRSSIYFKDESAHYEHPEKIEAALGDNTDVQIDISSVNGTNNVFYRRRQAGEVWTPEVTPAPGKMRIFLFDWRDHPGKDQAWYDKRRKKAEDEGLLHIFAQEVDRDYMSSLDRVIIPMKYIKAAIDAHVKLGWIAGGERISMQDVADEGGDRNAYTTRVGPVLKRCLEWGEGDTGETARKMVQLAVEDAVSECYYDCIGVGAGVKAETNRLKQIGGIPMRMRILPWNAASKPLNPTDNLIRGDIHTPKNEDYFYNLKAQAWWMLRVRFEKTYKAITQGAKYNPNEMISIPSTIDNLHKLCAELGQATIKPNVTSGKLVVDKKPDGGVSPNLADSVVGCYCPTKELSILDIL